MTSTRSLHASAAGTISGMGARLRFKVLSVVGLLAAGATSLAVACGGDEGGAGPACEGLSCDGGALSETSTTDSPMGTDSSTPPNDGGSEADADTSVVTNCGEGGAPGTLDESFGAGGMVWLKYPGAQATSVAVQADGKILVGGGTSPRRFALVRLLADGTPDPAFGVSGLVESKIATTYNLTYDAIAIQPDGKIVAVGAADFEVGSRSYDFTVVRYATDGSLDTTFGNGGFAAVDFGAADFTADYAKSVVVLADGRIVVAGFSEKGGVTSKENFAMARLTANGALDATFGNDGRVSIDVSGTADSPGVLAVLPSGKLIVGGGVAQSTSDSAQHDVAVVGLTANGLLDTSVGDGGVAVMAYGKLFNSPVRSIVTDLMGRVVLGGIYSNPSGPDDFGLSRMTAAGVLDSTFGDGGALLTDFAGRSDGAGAVVVQPDGKIVAIGGSTAGAGTGSIAAVRYLATGQLDSTFATAGRLLTSPPPNADLTAASGAISGCTLVAVGTWDYDTNTVLKTAMGIARYRR